MARKGGNLMTASPKGRGLGGTLLGGVITLVAILSASACASGTAVENPSSQPASAAGPFVRSVQAVTRNDALVLTDEELTTTGDTGVSWRRLSPDGLDLATISGVDFIDSLQGWVLFSAPSNTATPQLSVARTSDGGSTWHTAPVNSPRANDNLSRGGYVYFLDSKHGWVVAVKVTSSQHSEGALYRTVDGGVTWQELNIPLGQPVAFANEKDGTVAGGPTGDKVFTSHNGGKSWEAMNLTVPAELASSYPAFRTPVFFSSEEGVLPASFTSDRTAIGFYATSDGGRTWELTGWMTTQESLDMGVAIPADAVDANTMIAVTDDGAKVFSTTDKGANWSVVSPNGLPSGVLDVDFASAKVGWALVQNNICLSFKRNCIETQDLYRTPDGGQTWEKVDLSASAGSSEAGD
jgi:photosystem II stability/assembly factor-like uncharacterized protein